MDVLAAIVSRIVAAADPDKIILFGSRACNDVSLIATTTYWFLRQATIIKGSLPKSFTWRWQTSLSLSTWSWKTPPIGRKSSAMSPPD